jgi:hypothetical protein
MTVELRAKPHLAHGVNQTTSAQGRNARKSLLRRTDPHPRTPGRDCLLQGQGLNRPDNHPPSRRARRRAAMPSQTNDVAGLGAEQSRVVLLAGSVQGSRIALFASRTEAPESSAPPAA